MMKRSPRHSLLYACLVATLASGLPRKVLAADKSADLNGDGVSESVVSLTVVSSSPVQIRNKVTNKAAGKAFTFSWASAGPGGFASSVAAGTAKGVGAQWDWSTVSTVYSYTGNTCGTGGSSGTPNNDICFTETSPAAGTPRGPFSVPGRSLTAGGVTLSSAALTSSVVSAFALLTSNQTSFASGNGPLVTLTSRVDQMSSGAFRYKTIIENGSANPIAFDLLHPPLPCSGCFKGTVSPGATAEVCQTDPHPATEQANQFFVCGADIPDGPDQVRCSDNQPASRGDAMILVPGSATVGSVFLTPYQIAVTDPDGNGLIEPGETASLKVFLLNAGPMTLTAASATLSSPPVDLTDDGVSEPVPANITQPSSAYPDIQGTPPTGPSDCNNFHPAPVNPSMNSVAFVVSLPPSHPGDVGRPFNLSVSGKVGAGGPDFQMDVPLVIGIGSATFSAVPALGNWGALLLVSLLLGLGTLALRRLAIRGARQSV